MLKADAVRGRLCAVALLVLGATGLEAQQPSKEYIRLGGRVIAIENYQPITVAISPSSATLAAGGQVQFTATVTGTTNTAVTRWLSVLGIAVLMRRRSTDHGRGQEPSHVGGAMMPVRWLCVFITVVMLGFAGEAGPGNGKVKPGINKSALTRNLMQAFEQLGPRLAGPDTNRVILSGTLTDARGSRPAVVVWQYPGLFRLEKQGPDKPFVDQHAEDPQSWSLYAYARNNPLKLIDVQGNAAQKPVPGAPGYTYRPDLNNQNDNPNFHIFNSKGQEMGRISVQEVPTEIDPKTGKQLTGLGYEVEGIIPRAVREGIRTVVNEKGIKPRFAMGGGPFKGFTVAGVGALAIADVLIQAADLAVQTNRTGIGVNMAPWNYGSLYIADPRKAAATLGNGTYIEYTNKKGNTTIYQVQDGRFVKPQCNGKDCELTDTNSGNMFHVSGFI